MQRNIMVHTYKVRESKKETLTLFMCKYYKNVTKILNIYYNNATSIEKFTPVTYNIREDTKIFLKYRRNK